MHFSIPDTRDIKEDSGSPYVAYNIHVNGTFHCTVRYRQLHNLHDQLKREFGHNALPSFPPKKILPLTPLQTEERRALLEKYVQLVSQDSRIVNSEVFNGFLLSAQQESLNITETDVEVNVYLMNWQKLTVSVKSNSPSSHVLEAVSALLSLSPDLSCYFCLYLVHKENSNITIHRRLEDFEAPFMTLKTAGPNHYLTIRKSYWDSSYDEEVLDDRVALNLLYVQALSDVELGWVSATKEIQRQLAALQSRGSKLEYVQLARTLKYYGYLQFKPCVCDYPKPGSKVLISVGGKELNFRVQMSADQIKEMSFRVTRIRCWRITTSHQEKCANGNCASDGNARLELSFEYLVNKDKLQWIAITSHQAILMSVCLQAMVEELLMKRSGTQYRKSQDQQKFGGVNGNPGVNSTRRGSWSYMKRDGSSHQISISRSVSTDGIVSNATTPQMEHPKNCITARSNSDVKKVAEKLAAVSIKPSSKGGNASTARALVENDAFEGIGDDDL